MEADRKLHGPRVAAVVLALAALGVGAGVPAPASGAQAESSHGSAKKADHGVSAAAQEAAQERGKTGSGRQQASKDAGHGGAPWSYEGRRGPEHWGQLSKDYHLCMLGAAQSPIDIGATPFDGATVAPIAFDYRLGPLEVVNTGHTVQLNYAPGSGITVRGTRFELLQVHFHTPSEHALGGRRAPMEVHLVHRSAGGELAVIGIMVREGEESLALSEFWNLMPRQAGETKRDKRTLVNARDLLPHDPGYYRYMGSLTTPPCSEGVNWYVMATPMSASAEQIERIEKIVGANARPVQAVNRRLVLAPNAGATSSQGANH